jgi:hypothetical protein
VIFSNGFAIFDRKYINFFFPVQVEELCTQIQNGTHKIQLGLKESAYSFIGLDFKKEKSW